MANGDSMRIKNLGIIAARKGSKGIPDKNKKLLGGIPLVEWTLKAAHGSKLLDMILLTTDDEEIVRLTKGYRVEAPFIRTPELSTDSASMIDVISHSINFVISFQNVQIDNIVLLQPTTPFRTSEDIDNAISMFEQSHSDTLVSVCLPSQHPEDFIILNKLEGNRRIKLSAQTPVGRQQYEKVYFINGGIYISSFENFIKKTSFLNTDTILFEMPKSHSLDIDEPFDLHMAEGLLLQATENKNVWEL